MKNLEELLKELSEREMEYLCSDEYYTELILDDINEWLEEETEKQNYIEENLRKGDR